MFVKIWTPEALCDIIQTLRSTEPLNSHHFSTKFPSVYAAAEREFGSWRNAIEACGLNYDEIRKYRVWSRKKILDRIKEMHQQKMNLSCNWIQRTEKPLYMATVHRFKSWKTAIYHAGLDYDKIRIRRCMSPEQVKDEILGLYQKGIDLSYPNMRAKYQYLLAAGMKKLGDGSWAKARQVCGITENFRSPQHHRKFI